MNRDLDGFFARQPRGTGRRRLLTALAVGPVVASLAGCSNERQPSSIFVAHSSTEEARLALADVRRNAVLHGVQLRPREDNYGANGPLRPEEALVFEPWFKTRRNLPVGEAIILTTDPIESFMPADSIPASLVSGNGTVLTVERFSVKSAYAALGKGVLNSSYGRNAVIGIEYTAGNLPTSPRQQAALGMTLYLNRAGQIHGYRFQP